MLKISYFLSANVKSFKTGFGHKIGFGKVSLGKRHIALWERYIVFLREIVSLREMEKGEEIRNSEREREKERERKRQIYKQAMISLQGMAEKG